MSVPMSMPGFRKPMHQGAWARIRCPRVRQLQMPRQFAAARIRLSRALKALWASMAGTMLLVRCRIVPSSRPTAKAYVTCAIDAGWIWKRWYWTCITPKAREVSQIVRESWRNTTSPQGALSDAVQPPFARGAVFLFELTAQSLRVLLVARQHQVLQKRKRHSCHGEGQRPSLTLGEPSRAARVIRVDKRAYLGQPSALLEQMGQRQGQVIDARAADRGLARLSPSASGESVGALGAALHYPRSVHAHDVAVEQHVQGEASAQVSRVAHA